MAKGSTTRGTELKAGGGGRGGGAGSVHATPNAANQAPQTTEARRVNMTAESLFDAVKTPAGLTAGWDSGAGAGGQGNSEGRRDGADGKSPTPTAERRSAALVLQLAELRSWMQDVLRVELPPGDLPTLLQDGELLMALADAAMPGVAAPYVGSLPSRKFEAFATACRKLGVSEGELLHESALLPGPAQRSADAVATALGALAREASRRKLLPPLG